jgi:DivIVA domain-containing protein
MSANPVDFSRYVKRVRFRRRLLGYHPADVDRHLDLVRGWFSLAGLNEIAQERLGELEDEAQQRLTKANDQAERVLADARSEAAGVVAAAKAEAEAIARQARRQAVTERRGRTQLGRPVGSRLDRR